MILLLSSLFFVVESVSETTQPQDLYCPFLFFFGEDSDK